MIDGVSANVCGPKASIGDGCTVDGDCVSGSFCDTASTPANCATTTIPQVDGGVVYPERCVPGYNDWGELTGLTWTECYEWCRDEPECKTSDYLNGSCFPSKSGYDLSEPYIDCYMWVKDTINTSVPSGTYLQLSLCNCHFF